MKRTWRSYGEHDWTSQRPGTHGRSLTGTRGVYRRGDRYVARFARGGIEYHMQYFDTIPEALGWINAARAARPA